MLNSINHTITLVNITSRVYSEKDLQSLRYSYPNISEIIVTYEQRTEDTIESLISLAQSKNIDLIHSRSYFSTVFALHIKNRLNIPYIFDMRGFQPLENYMIRKEEESLSTYDSQYFKDKELELKLIENSQYSIVVTDEMKTYLQDQYPQFKNKFKTISLSSTLSYYPKKVVKKLRFIFCGNLFTKWYSEDRLVTWMEYLSKNYPSKFLLVLWINSDQQQLFDQFNEKVNKLNLDLKIVVNSKDTSSLYRESDIGLIPFNENYRESLQFAQSIKFVEYLSNGLYVISSNESRYLNRVIGNNPDLGVTLDKTLEFEKVDLNQVVTESNQLKRIEYARENSFDRVDTFKSYNNIYNGFNSDKVSLGYLVFGDNIASNGIIQTQVFNFLETLFAKGEIENGVIINITNRDDYLEDGDLKIYMINNTSMDLLVEKIKRVLDSENINTLHCRSYYSGYIGSKLKERYNIPFIFDLRGKFPQENHLFRLDSSEGSPEDSESLLARDIAMEKEIVESSLCNIVMNNHYKNYLSNLYNLDNIKVVNNFTPKHSILGNWGSNRFIYSGNLNSAWIDFELMMKWIKSIDSISGTMVFIIYGVTEEEISGLNTILSKIMAHGKFEIYHSPDREKYNEIISSCEYGLIPHKKFYKEILEVAQPLKYLDYISFGLKLIATPYCLEIAEFIRENSAGIINEDDLDLTSTTIISNKEIRKLFTKRYRANNSIEKTLELYKRSIKTPTAYIVYNEDITTSGIINSQLLPLLKYISENSNFIPTLIAIIPEDYNISPKRIDQLKNKYNIEIVIFREDNLLRERINQFLIKSDFKLLHFRSYLGQQFVDNHDIITIFDTRSILPLEEKLRAENSSDSTDSEMIYKHYLDLEAKNVKSSNRVITVNPIISQYFKDRYYIKTDTIELFSSEPFSFTPKDQLREKLKISKDRVVVLFSGAIQTPWYSLEKIFLWLKLLSKYNPVLIMQNYIDESKMDELKSYIYNFSDQLSISRDDIIINPKQLSYGEILQISDIGLIPFDDSYSESLYYATSSKLYDYLRFSLYVIAPNYSQHLNSLFDQNCEKGEVIGSKIDYIKLDRFLSNGRENNINNFSIEQGGTSYLKIYSELLDLPLVENSSNDLQQIDSDQIQNSEDDNLKPIKYRKYTDKDVEESVNRFILYLNREHGDKDEVDDSKSDESSHTQSIFSHFEAVEDLTIDDETSHTEGIFNMFTTEGKEECKEDKEEDHTDSIFNLFNSDEEKKDDKDDDHTSNIFGMFN